MLYEYQLGKESLWFPYLNLLPLDIEFFCNWTPEELLATDDHMLIVEANQYKKDIEKEWNDIRLILISYPEHFNVELQDRKLFMRIFA